MKKSFLSALVFFGTITVLTIGYATWNNPFAMSTVGSGSGLTANGWNALVNNLNDLNTRLASAEATITNLSASGAVMAFNRTACPTGWSPANGAGGSPDLRGEFIRGLDNQRGVDSGRILASSQADIFASHNHVQDAHNHVQDAHGHSLSYPGLGLIGSNETGGNVTGLRSLFGRIAADTLGSNWVADSTTATNQATTATNQATGGLETRPRNVAFLYCIKD